MSTHSPACRARPAPCSASSSARWRWPAPPQPWQPRRGDPGRRGRRRRGRHAGAAAENSLRFAVIGDTGTGDSAAVRGRRAARPHRATVVPFEFVLMLGDNIYGGERPQDFVKKFEQPYKALLDAEDPVLRLARQPRRSRTSASTSRSTWTASASTRSSKERRRASSRSTATTWTRRSSTGSRRS